MGRKKIPAKDWFSVSFTSTRKAARKEKKGMKKGTGYRYKVKRNPDKKGWTIFGRRE